MDPKYLVVHDRIAKTPCFLTEPQLREMLHDLHTDDPEGGWDITLDIGECRDICAVGPSWFNGRELIALRCPDGAIAYKFSDPVEPARWVYDEGDLCAIKSEDPNLIMEVST